jgi:hypothetical protein
LKLHELESCRASVFRNRLEASPQMVEQVEKQIIELMHGEAPEGWVIEDVAEIYVADANGGGKWVPLSEAPSSMLKPDAGQ